jgi:hypothetical protein
MAVPAPELRSICGKRRAGLILLPVLFGMSPMRHAHHDIHTHIWMMSRGPWVGTPAVAAHTRGDLLITGTVAFVALRKTRFESFPKGLGKSDLIWTVALIVTAGVALLVPAS